MVRAIAKIRENFDKPLEIGDIAWEFHMSLSGLHAHFKAVTAMSPLQFQKQPRLQEARRLMLSENLDATEGGYRVGYDDASHFSREYKRHLGEPPKRDVEHLSPQEVAIRMTPERWPRIGISQPVGRCKGIETRSERAMFRPGTIIRENQKVGRWQEFR
jgi:AraC-like DNA-binding protein